ncbi:bifunctional oligoribonuclease/PAP phosphatase NrnA [Lactobacillus sp. S2-2]|uniref:DHH family phosphoesterase n=1 Tax=Lactobacillus sp. S2-2 TaxID=2692917 RepID=UPI001F45D7C2|nr:bifunctional oligoribonuclease/PAP phosphatase NrnA [Lactobacillus sp. S2-2]MCF6515809.1 bifunctional oligoribonuclease/PAP phosphatase NrnA [Lactobacillus sp. S2-2]
MEIQQLILEKIKAYKNIIIHRHAHPDPDAMGSQNGLAEILKESFPEKNIYRVGKQYDTFNWIGESDDVSDDIYSDALVIVVDTANQPRVDDMRYDTGDYLIKIDHHPNDDQFGDLMLVQENASSTSEIIFQLFEEFNELKLTDAGAKSLYAGIVGDTGRFKYQSTTSETLYAASELAKYNFSTTEVSQIEDEIDLPLSKLSAYLYNNLEILPSGLAYITLTDELIEQFNLNDHSTNAVVPLPGLINVVKTWAIFVEDQDKSYRVRLRSKDLSINEIAKKHDGGGHPLASGAKAKDSEEIKQIISELNQLLINNQ